MSSAGMAAPGGFFGSMSQGSPAGFTSPGMNPQALAALLAMLSGQSQGGAQPGGAPAAAPGGPPMGGAPPGMPPGASALPPNSTLAPGATLPGSPPGAPAGAPPQAAAPPGGVSPQLQALMKMDPNALKAILQRLGIGGSPAAPPSIPGSMVPGAA